MVAKLISSRLNPKLLEQIHLLNHQSLKNQARKLSKRQRFQPMIQRQEKMSMIMNPSKAQESTDVNVSKDLVPRTEDPARIVGRNPPNIAVNILVLTVNRVSLKALTRESLEIVEAAGKEGGLPTMQRLKNEIDVYQ